MKSDALMVSSEIFFSSLILSPFGFQDGHHPFLKLVCVQVQMWPIVFILYTVIDITHGRKPIDFRWNWLKNMAARGDFVNRNFTEAMLSRGHSGRVVNTLASHLWGWGSVPGTASSGKVGSCLPLVGSLQYRTLTNCIYWFPLPFQLPAVIWPVQCWKQHKTPNK